MNHITITRTYSCNAIDNVELPQGKTTDDILEVLISYDVATIRFKDGTQYRADIESDIDWRRPNKMEVFACDKFGQTDYGQELDVWPQKIAPTNPK